VKALGWRLAHGHAEEDARSQVAPFPTGGVAARLSTGDEKAAQAVFNGGGDSFQRHSGSRYSSGGVGGGSSSK
jgi:hypothetical protein